MPKKFSTRAIRCYRPYDPFMSLAQLGLGRAYATQGNVQKSRTAYQDFFALWKDVDPDVRILKEARAEYAKLQNGSSLAEID